MRKFLLLLMFAPLNGRTQLLSSVAKLIETEHYRPKVIDDSFSAALWRRYIEMLDPLKGLFLRSDLETLSTYRFVLDDEIRGERVVAFLPAALRLYRARLSEAVVMDSAILSNPFRYDVDETVRPDGGSLDDFAGSLPVLREARRKMLKYLSLQYLVMQRRTGFESDSLARQKAREWLAADYARLWRDTALSVQMGRYVDVMGRLMDPHTDYFFSGVGSGSPSTVDVALIRSSGRRVGYVSFPEFYGDSLRHCASDVSRALRTLDSARVDGIVFDLRDNHGGSLQEVLRMTGLLIPRGPVVQVRRRSGAPVALSSDADSVVYDGPLAILVNEKTASAAELFTAAIQDYHRGIVIGSRTYGKGTVQRSFPVDSGVLKLTIEQFFRVSGGSTQLAGVTPDVCLPDVYAFQKVREADNAGALGWDTIPPVAYAPGPALYGGAFSPDSVFGVIQRNNTWLGARRDSPVSLDLSVFTAGQDARQAILLQDRDALTLPAGRRLDVMALTPGDRRWVMAAGRDIYINEALRVLEHIREPKS
ncbi:MAG TPA: S41 family peptidase [Dinghuibacter sp.]|uniref:S41 family peptidase n=1 Tax=Dinghuibacter sp. TaxID=2024697 RepID=UPI002C7ED874|nr:S41 family peptidase [Dinghuibacter sp.]HTJ13729.1 S41 family peptidase [Dinghuibacter sp.]